MRGKQAPKRDITPDPRYNSTEIAKFINYIMKGGKKTVAQNILYGAFDIIEKKMKKNPMEVYELALKNVGPSLEVRGRRIGGGNYQIPYPVRAERRFTLACRWILEAAKKRKGSMAQRLAGELMDASQELGEAYKKKNRYTQNGGSKPSVCTFRPIKSLVNSFAKKYCLTAVFFCYNPNEI